MLLLLLIIGVLQFGSMDACVGVEIKRIFSEFTPHRAWPIMGVNTVVNNGGDPGVVNIHTN